MYVYKWIKFNAKHAQHFSRKSRQLLVLIVHKKKRIIIAVIGVYNITIV
jgi:hypothetical protein